VSVEFIEEKAAEGAAVPATHDALQRLLSQDQHASA
jgi:hypothetical protein